MKPISLILPIVFILVTNLTGQYVILADKTDDFNRSLKGWWDYHRDGSAQSDPRAIRIENGCLILSLNDPVSASECNVGISEHQNIYGKSIARLVFETRLKVLNDMKPGSRGWGFWKAARGGRATSLAWFMEQLLPGHADLTFRLAGAISKRRRQTRAINVDLRQWNIYRVERDLTSNSSRFYINDQLIMNTGGISPAEKMSLHAWVDNQVYNSTRGITRTEWKGSSAIAIDYIRVTTTQQAQPAWSDKDKGVIWFSKGKKFGRGGAGQELETVPFTNSAQSVLIAVTALAEEYGPLDSADRLSLTLDQSGGPLYSWAGKQLQGSSVNFTSLMELEPGVHQLKFIADNTPCLSDVTILSLDGGTVKAESSELTPLNADHSRSPFKEITIKSSGGLHHIYLSGSADATPGWNLIGSEGPFDAGDDELRIVLDEIDFGWKTKDSLWGNRDFGNDRVILISRYLAEGSHSLKIYTRNNPKINRLLVYGR